MTKNRIVKYATNTALLAVLAAAGIGAYQLGTSKPEEKYPGRTGICGNGTKYRGRTHGRCGNH